MGEGSTVHERLSQADWNKINIFNKTLPHTPNVGIRENRYKLLHRW